jgi:hypothetical protein
VRLGCGHKYRTGGRVCINEKWRKVVPFSGPLEGIKGRSVRVGEALKRANVDKG